MKTLLLPLCLLVAFPLAAQDIHISGGYNGTNVRETGNERWVGLAGYQFGADVLLGRRWFVKPGVHFVVRNLNYTMSTGTGISAQEFRYTSRSLSVPAMLGVRLRDPYNDPSFNIYALGGPTALFGLSADLHNDELDVRTKDMQWYLGAGGGLTFDFLFLEAGYNVAMTNVFDGDAFATNPRANYMYAVAGLRLKLAD